MKKAVKIVLVLLITITTFSSSIYTRLIKAEDSGSNPSEVLEQSNNNKDIHNKEEEVIEETPEEASEEESKEEIPQEEQEEVIEEIIEEVAKQEEEQTVPQLAMAFAAPQRNDACSASTVAGQTCTISNESELKAWAENTNSTSTNAITGTVSTDITISSSIEVVGTKILNLGTNKIIGNKPEGTNHLRMFVIPSASTVVINGESKDNRGTICGNTTEENRMAGFYVQGKLTLNNLILKSFQSYANAGTHQDIGGGFAYVGSQDESALPTLIINGSEIDDAYTLTYQGGAINQSNGTVTIDDSTITNCKTGANNNYGGAIYSSKGILNISNTSISNNSAGYYGAIYLSSNVTASLSNCDIQNNTSANGAGGVDSHGELHLSGKIIIDNNKASGMQCNLKLSGSTTAAIQFDDSELDEGSVVKITSGGSPTSNNKYIAKADSVDILNNNLQYLSIDNNYYDIVPEIKDGSYSTYAIIENLIKNVTYTKTSGIKGEVPVDTESYTKGEDAVVLSDQGKLTKSNAIIVGWKDELGNRYLPGDTITMDRNHTLTAEFKNTYDISIIYKVSDNKGQFYFNSVETANRMATPHGITIDDEDPTELNFNNFVFNAVVNSQFSKPYTFEFKNDVTIEFTGTNEIYANPSSGDGQPAIFKSNNDISLIGASGATLTLKSYNGTSSTDSSIKRAGIVSKNLTVNGGDTTITVQDSYGNNEGVQYGLLLDEKLIVTGGDTKLNINSINCLNKINPVGIKAKGISLTDSVLTDGEYTEINVNVGSKGTGNSSKATGLIVTGTTDDTLINGACLTLATPELAYSGPQITLVGTGIRGTDSAAKPTVEPSKKTLYNSTNKTYQIDKDNTYVYSDALSLISFPAYKVVYNSNGGTGTLPTDYHIENSLITLSDGTGLTYTGHVIDSWNTSEDGTGTEYKLGSAFNKNEDLTLYAIWKPVEKQVKVYYNDTQYIEITAKYGEDMPSLTVTMPTKQGHVFKGFEDNSNTLYYKVEDGEIKSAKTWDKDSGDSFELHPKFVPNTYKVTLDQNYDEAPAPTQIDVDFGSINKNSGTPTRSQYTFDGYYSEKEGGTKYFNNDGSAAIAYNIVGNTTLYAHWTKKVTRTLELDPNYSGSIKQEKEMVVDEEYQLPSISRTGYSFDGWYDDQSGGNKVETFVMTDGTAGSKVTLYGRWNEKTSTVTFDSNEGTGGPSQKVFTYDQTYSQISNTDLPTRNGYKFDGYWTQATDGEQYYDADGNPTKDKWNIEDATKTLYAHWIANNSRILVLDPNYSGGSKTEVSVLVGDQYSPVDISRTGFGFEGWFESPEEGGTKVTTFTMPSGEQTTKVTLYAHWETYYTGLRFANTEQAYVDAIYGEPVPTITPNVNPPEGTVFEGYYSHTEQQTKKTKYYNADGTSAHVCDVTGAEITLFAHYDPIDYTLHFDANIPTGTTSTLKGSTPDIIYNKDSGNINVPNGFELPGYRFIGWASEPNGEVIIDPTSGEKFDASQNIKNTTLYAKWSPLQSRIEFDSQGGSTTSTIEYVTYDQVIITQDRYAPTKTGYIFDGFYSMPGGAGVKYYGKDDDGKLTVENNKVWDIPTENYGSATLYANWTPIKYKVIFNNGGETVEQTFTYNQPQNLKANEFTKTGNLFIGWSINNSPTADVKYEDKEIVNNLKENEGDTLNLYARWYPITYTITFDKKGGSGGDDTKTSTYGFSLGVVNAPSKIGYDFNGYYDIDDNKYFDSQGYSVVEDWDKDEDTVLIAKWTPHQYTIKYNNNSEYAQGEMTSSTHEFGTEKQLTKNTFTREHNTFVGWSRNDYDTTPEFIDETSVKNLTAENGGEVDLYAIWKPDTFSISYNGTLTEEELESAITEYDFSEDYPQSLSTYIYREGYVLQGFYDNTQFTGTPIQSIPAGTAENISLYAKWVERGVMVFAEPIPEDPEADPPIYHGSAIATLNGEPISPMIGAPAGSTVVIQTQVDEGYQVDQITGKYYVDMYTPAQSLTITNSSFVIPNDAVAIYVEVTFKVKENTVTYDGNNADSGTVPVDETKYTIGSPVTVLDNTGSLAKTGYTFNGWNTKADGSGTSYVAGSTFNFAEPITLYADWQLSSTTITLDQQQGTGGTTSINVNYGDDMPTTGVTAPTRTGYTFGGYYDQTGGQGNQYYTKDLTSNKTWDKEVTESTLYAKWTPIESTVTLNPNGGTKGTVESLSVTYDEVISPITTQGWKPTRTGYTFDGYYDAQTGGNKIFNDDGSVTTVGKKWDITENKSLFAHWTANEYTVTLNPNDGTTTGHPTVTATYDSDMPTTGVTAPTRTGYTFDGYYDSTLNTKYYTNEIVSVKTWDVANDSELFAKWNEHNYKVVFNSNGATSGEMSDETFTYSEEKALTTNTYSKTGYTFKGWSKSSDAASVDYEDGASVSKLTSTDNGTINLYAVWEANTYDVVFDGNGATSGSMDNQEFTYDVKGTLNANQFVRTGYTFLGWSTDQSATTPTYTGATNEIENLSTGADITLYAIWKKTDYSLTVSNVTGGTITATPNPSKALDKLNVGDTVDLSYVLDNGYSFVKWDITGGGTLSGNTFTMPAGNVTVSATFSSNAYGITINEVTGGKVEANAQSAEAGDSVTLTITPDTGYKFVNAIVKNSADATIATITPESSKVITMPSSAITITPTFEKETYTITYYLNDGVSPTSPNPGSYQLSESDITLNDPTRTGYTFDGWYNNAQFTGSKITKIVAGSTGNKDLYAKWNQKTSKVVFNNNPSSKTYDDIDISYGTVLNALDSTKLPTRTGYTFGGYEDSTHKKYYNGDGSVASGITASKWDKEDANVTLNAIWTIKNSSITKTSVVPNNCSVTVNSTADYNEKVYINVVKTDNYNVSATVTDDVTGSSITVSEDAGGMYFVMPENACTVNVVFEGKTYNVTYYVNGGKVVGGTTYKYGVGLTLPTPTKEGSQFKGWYDSPTFGGEAITAIGTDASGNKTYYAKWEENTYTIQLDKEYQAYAEGSLSLDKSSAKYGETITATIHANNGYKVKTNGLYYTKVGDLAGVDYRFTGNTFTMPASNIVVGVDFEKVPVTGLKVAKNEIYMKQGNTHILPITFEPVNAYNGLTITADNNLVTVTHLDNGNLSITAKNTGTSGDVTTTITITPNEASKQGIKQVITVHISDEIKIVYKEDFETNQIKAPLFILNDEYANFFDTTLKGEVKIDDTVLNPLNNDYWHKEGSVEVTINPEVLRKLELGKHTIHVTSSGVTADAEFEIKVGHTPSPTPSPSPSKDESCEKVIGPTWHWNNRKGVCEEVSVIGTSTR